MATHDEYLRLCYGRHVIDDLGQDYPMLLRVLRQHGDKVESRIGPCHEAQFARMVLRHPERCVVDRDGFSAAFMREEIVQLLAGVHDNDRLRAVVPRAADLITPHTAYGPRTWEQLSWVEEELHDHPESRRAVVYVGRHDDLMNVDNDTTAGEMPCTAIWQFMIRDQRLDMCVTMRSWDCVWGLPYDVASFVAVQMALAKALDVPLGAYVHQAGSMHLYAKHVDVVARENTNSLLDVSDLLGDTMGETQTICRDLLDA